MLQWMKHWKIESIEGIVGFGCSFDVHNVCVAKRDHRGLMH